MTVSGGAGTLTACASSYTPCLSMAWFGPYSTQDKTEYHRLLQEIRYLVRPTETPSCGFSLFRFAQNVWMSAFGFSSELSKRMTSPCADEVAYIQFAALATVGHQAIIAQQANDRLRICTGLSKSTQKLHNTRALILHEVLDQ